MWLMAIAAFHSLPEHFTLSKGSINKIFVTCLSVGMNNVQSSEFREYNYSEAHGLGIK